MLEHLARLAGAVEPGFGPKDVRWAIACDGRGRFLEVLELGDAGAKANRGQTFALCPVMDRSIKQSGGKSEFLVDTAANALLLDVGPGDTKTRAKHSYFVGLIRQAAATMPELAAVLRLLENPETLRQVQERLTDLGARPTDIVTFRVGDLYPVESRCWHSWWRARLAELTAARRARKQQGQMICLVTGRDAFPLLTHPKIRGLVGVGGQRSGDVLIGFDKPAFQSYGLDQSANAAVSEESATAYSIALNDLIRKSGRKLAGTLVVHWYMEKVKREEDPLSWLEDPPGTEELSAKQWASDLLSSVESGRRPDLAGNRYYALTLSGAAGRVMVRDWMEGEFEALVTSIRRWFDDLAIVGRDGTTAPAPKFLDVIRATVGHLQDVPAPFVARMWRAAVRCECIPQAALAQALSRARVAIIAGEPFNHARMGLLKAYLRRSQREDGGEMNVSLNEAHPAPAYHCGRMMAVLAKLQQAALGDVGAGVIQRYYAAASTTPALVLGRLVRGGQFHLSKLESRGLAHWYEEKLGSIAARLGDSVPKTLSLEEQSQFALGYYQQWVELRAGKSKDSD